MTFATFELRVLAWVMLAWLVLVLTVLTNGAPLAGAAFAVWRRILRWRRARARAQLEAPQAVSV